jgi:hypothetical protein
MLREENTVGFAKAEQVRSSQIIMPDGTVTSFHEASLSGLANQPCLQIKTYTA